MTNNYYDGGGNRINRDRYQRLITEWLIRRVGSPPYIINPRTGRRRSVALPLIQQRRRGGSARVRSNRCGYRPQNTHEVSSTPTTANNSIDSQTPNAEDDWTDEEKISQTDLKNRWHPLFHLKKKLEAAVSKKTLRRQLRKHRRVLKTTPPISHHYNQNNEWNFEEGDSTDITHPFYHLRSTYKQQ